MKDEQDYACAGCLDQGCWRCTDLEAQARDDELGAAYGDPRRCPRHPHIATSSADGMFDGVCGECEYEMSMDDAEREGWDHNPENPHRPHCSFPRSLVATWDMRRAVTCRDVVDPNEIWF